MAEIIPFAAYRYNLERVRLPDVVTQPYDKISPAMQERYVQNSPYNLIAVEKGQAAPTDSPTDNVYTRAEQALAQWIRDGILLRDSAPGNLRLLAGVHRAGKRRTPYAQRLHRPGPRRGLHRRSSFPPRADAGRSQGGPPGIAPPHAHHTGQLFMLYDDPERRVDELLAAATRSVTPVEARDEYGVVHRLWPVFDPAVIAGVKREMAPRKSW